MSRFWRFSRVALPVVTAAGCVASRPDANAPLTYYESYDPRSLDPALSTDVPTGEMVTLIYDGLTRFEPNGTLAAALADRWTVDSQGLRYVFHLRPAVKFHDGSPVTAEAVRRSFLRVLDPRSTGGRAWPLLPIAGASEHVAGTAADVQGIEVLGDTAVALTLALPLAVFPKFLAMLVASIVPANPPPDLGAQPVSTGPWRFAVWAHDDALRFARNPDYWGGAPLAESLVVRIIPDQLVRAAELESGRLDVVEVPFGETARWRERHPAWLQEKPALRVTYIALNNRRGALRDVRVRQAINHAVNVGQILTTVWSGRGHGPTGVCLRSGAGEVGVPRPAHRPDPGDHGAGARHRQLPYRQPAHGIDLRLAGAGPVCADRHRETGSPGGARQYSLHVGGFRARQLRRGPDVCEG